VFKHFYRRFISTCFIIVIQILWTVVAHTFLMFKSCVTTWWTVHSLIFSLVIVRIVKHCSLWMKALTWSMFVRLRFIFHHFSRIYEVFVPPKYLST
jgi:hypothetical protein